MIQNVAFYDREEFRTINHLYNELCRAVSVQPECPDSSESKGRKPIVYFPSAEARNFIIFSSFEFPHCSKNTRA